MNDFFPSKQNDFIKSSGTIYLINCGTLENLHRNVNFQPKFSDGLCLVYKHILAPNATFNFKYLLSQTLPSGMRMGCMLRPKMRDHIIVMNVNDEFDQIIHDSHLGYTTTRS